LFSRSVYSYSLALSFLLLSSYGHFMERVVEVFSQRCAFFLPHFFRLRFWFPDFLSVPALGLVWGQRSPETFLLNFEVRRILDMHFAQPNYLSSLIHLDKSHFGRLLSIFRRVLDADQAPVRGVFTSISPSSRSFLQQKLFFSVFFDHLRSMTELAAGTTTFFPQHRVRRAVVLSPVVSAIR